MPLPSDVFQSFSSRVRHGGSWHVNSPISVVEGSSCPLCVPSGDHVGVEQAHFNEGFSVGDEVRGGNTPLIGDVRFLVKRKCHLMFLGKARGGRSRKYLDVPSDKSFRVSIQDRQSLGQPAWLGNTISVGKGQHLAPGNTYALIPCRVAKTVGLGNGLQIEGIFVT